MQMIEEIAKADASTAWCLGQCASAPCRRPISTPMRRRRYSRRARHPRLGPDRGMRCGWSPAATAPPRAGISPVAYGRRVGSAPMSGHRGGRQPAAQARRLAGNPYHPVPDDRRHDLRRLGRDRPERHRHRLLSVDNLFITAHSPPCATIPALREKGALYKMSTNMVVSMGFAAISLGVARAMLDSFTDLARGKTPFGLKPMRDNNAVQALLGRTEATYAPPAPISTPLRAKSGTIWRAVMRSPVSIVCALRLASTWTIHQSASVVDAAYHLAGATAVFSANNSNAGSATCTPSPSRSRPAIRTTRMPARRSCSPISARRRRRADEAGEDNDRKERCKKAAREKFDIPPSRPSSTPTQNRSKQDCWRCAG